MIMHAHLDTDIREGIERERVGYNARAIVGFVPILPLVSEKIAFSRGGIENAAEERTQEVSTLVSIHSRDSVTATKTNRGIARQRLPPKISKLFEAI